MDREKQIEEIANILWHIPGNYFLNSYNDCERIAECIYDDGGYRKVSKNYIGTDEILRSIDYRPTEEVRKETAKEFAEKVKQAIVDNTYPYFDKNGKPVNIWNTDGFDRIDELLKEYEK